MANVSMYVAGECGGSQKRSLTALPQAGPGRAGPGRAQMDPGGERVITSKEKL